MASGSFSAATTGAGEAGEDTASHVNSFVVKLASLVQGMSQQTEACMENLLVTVSEISQSLVEIMDDLNSTREFALDRRSRLDASREKIQQAACRVMDMLNGTNDGINAFGNFTSREKDDSDN